MNNKRKYDCDRELIIAKLYVDAILPDGSAKNRILRPENGTWDFSIATADDTGWDAIEIKGLVDSDFERGFWTAETFCERVEERLSGSLRGKLVIVSVPKLAVSQKVRAAIIDAVANVALKELPNLRVNEKINLGPSILAVCQDWPTELPQGRFDANGKYVVIYRPIDFWVYRGKGKGSSFVSGAMLGNPTEMRAQRLKSMQQIFGKDTSQPPKWTRQLGSAKSHGARHRILLLDDRTFIPAPDITYVMTQLPRTWVEVLSSAYLVRPGLGVLEQVWPRQ